MNGQATKGSFWELIDGKKIEIPKYQREYAQGRNNRSAEGIRTGLVNALYDALDKNTPLELDFIFGGNEDDNDKENNNNDKFHPVDGQQRLTILYLLHWYIFQRAGDESALSTLHDNFSYATRTTSRSFCENICKPTLSLNWSGGNISAQLRNMPWFTGAMGHDPTVKSMLVVIDCIHNKFKDADFNEFAKKLKGDCPITFYYYDLSGASTTFNVRDLYIKMNARGLALTDFEIFKAELQKTVQDGFDLLKSFFEKEMIADSSENRVKLIGKFNNEYTNFFFNLINDNVNGNRDTESDKFDQAMMNFINEIVRADFFCAASEKGVPQKTYRAHNNVVKGMSGKELYNFIRDSGKLLIDGYVDENGKRKNPYIDLGDEKAKNEFYSEIQKAFTNSIERIIDLCNLFSKNSDDSIFKKDIDRKIGYALFDELFRGDQKTSTGLAVDPLDNDNKTLSLGDFVARNALYAFLEKFKDNLNDARIKAYYDDWNRFVWKLVKNTDFGNFDEAVDTLRGLRKICKGINTSNSVSDVISNSANVTMGSSARLHFDEELLKSKFIVNDHTNQWKGAIIDAENYFNSDGEIWFLLDLAKTPSGYSYLNRFKKAVSIAIKIFKNEKKLQSDSLSLLFERALLAVGAYDNAFSGIDHLVTMSGIATNTKKFVGTDFSKHLSHSYAASGEDTDNRKRYDVTLALLRAMVDAPDFDPQNENDIETWLNDYLSGAKSGSNYNNLPDWKKLLLKYDLFGKTVGGFTFSNCLEPGAWTDDPTAIAIYNTTNKRINSAELHSFALACLIKDKIPVGYQLSQLNNYIENGFPNRYFTIKVSNGEEHRVAYYKGKYILDDVNTEIGDTIKDTIEDVCNELCNRLGI